MREKRQESEWILSYQRSLRSKSHNLSEGAQGKLLYTDDLVQIRQTIDGFRDRFLKWMDAFASKGLKDTIGKTKVMVSGDITNDGMSKSKVDPNVVCSLREKASFVWCVQCGIWIHG